MVTTREKHGKEQLTSDLAEAVTASQVTEAVQKQRKVDLHEQLLFMDPIQEAGTPSSSAQASHLKSENRPSPLRVARTLSRLARLTEDCV